MEEILIWIKQNPTPTAIIILLLAVFILYIIWQIQKKGLKPFIIDFIVKAEEIYNHGENQEKMDYVIDKIIALVPVPFSLIITRNMVKEIIQKVFNEIKKALDYKPIEQE